MQFAGIFEKQKGVYKKMAQTVTIRFDNTRNHVRIQKTTLEALGKPTYIRALYDAQNRTFILQPVTRHEIAENGYHLYDLMYVPNEVYDKDRPFEYQIPCKGNGRSRYGFHGSG